MKEMQNLTGKAWGRFQIIKERGRGGMAVVYKAYDGVLQRTVALKVLLPILASNQEFTRRFRREAITAANLKHPNIVIIYDVGSHNDYQYIVMEYLDGPTLQEEIQQKGAIPLPRAMSLLGQLTGALDHAHRQELVHRDVKPANIIIGARDHVTLTDFGLVKAGTGGQITTNGAAVGTLKYMSPEQAAGKELDLRSDVYSLGVVVFEMLTGEAPFTGTTPYRTLHEIMHSPPPPISKLNPHADPRVEGVLSQALSKDPDRRFRTAGEFGQTLASATGSRAPIGMPGETDSLIRESILRLSTPDGREYPVYHGQVTIGRDASNDIVLPVQQVSRHHAQIRCDEAGCKVVDAGSTNGTSVNGMHLPPGKPKSIRPGDVLRIGPIKLVVNPPSPTGQGESRTATMESLTT